MIKIEEIQKHRYSRGAIVYNTNNNRYAIVLNGKRGEDSDPASLVMELCEKDILLHTPPNRALIPTGQWNKKQKDCCCTNRKRQNNLSIFKKRRIDSCMVIYNGHPARNAHMSFKYYTLLQIQKTDCWRLYLEI